MVEVITSVERRRRWSGAEKERLVAASLEPGVSIPIIAVTSYALAGEADTARAAGCDAYIPKPYSTRQLLAKVREYLSLDAPTR